MLELYHAGLTSCSLKARLCLKEKGLTYVSRFVALQRFEQHRPEYLALNPNGVVPTLVHDGLAIYESSVINEYLDEVFPEPPLKPADAGSRARMRIWTRLADDAFGPNQVWNYAGRTGYRTGPQMAKLLTGAALDEKLAAVPLPERRATLEKVTRGGGFSEHEIALAREKAAMIVTRAERDLERSAWLAGDSYSLADVNMLPFIDRYKNRVVPDLITPARTPRLCAWYERAMARPASRAAFAVSDETRNPYPEDEASWNRHQAAGA